MAFSLLAFIREDHVAEAVASLLGVPREQLAETIETGMANLVAAQGYVYGLEFHPYDADYAAARVRLQVETVAGYLAADAALGQVFFPFARDEDADDAAVPFAETLIQAACIYAGSDYRTRAGRERLRAFRAAVAAV